MNGIDTNLAFTPMNIAVLVVSDTRSLTTDTSGQVLAERIVGAKHKLIDRKVVSDNIAKIRHAVTSWIADPKIDIIISTGGTGLTGRDVTPEAIVPLFEKKIDGFSNMFHMVSYESIGMSTLQSRAVAGLAKSTLIFCLPGSSGAVKDGWDKVISLQLDSRHRPCNFVELMPRFQEF